jgi:hypothetical protein
VLSNTFVIMGSIAAKLAVLLRSAMVFWGRGDTNRGCALCSVNFAQTSRTFIPYFPV